MANPMELEIHVRRSGDEPWGFRLIGGVDFDMPLTVIKVFPNSPSEKAGLQNGDTVTIINGEDATMMCHADSRSVVAEAGNVLSLCVVRGLYDPVLDDYEPIYETIDHDSGQPSRPTEVDLNADICPGNSDLLKPIHPFDIDPNSIGLCNLDGNPCGGQGMFDGVRGFEVDNLGNGVNNGLNKAQLNAEDVNKYDKSRDGKMCPDVLEGTNDFLRSLTASPYVGQAKPYRPFSTEPTEYTEVPPLEDPIILNPDYHDVFKEYGIEDFMPKTKFKLPISEQYDPDGTKQKMKQQKQQTFVDKIESRSANEKLESYVTESREQNSVQLSSESITTDVKSEMIFKEHTELKDVQSKEETKQEIAINQTESKDVQFTEKRKEEIDIGKISETATSIVAESLEKAAVVAEEIKKELNLELKDISSDIKCKSEVLESKQAVKKVSELVSLIDQTTKQVMKQNESLNVEKVSNVSKERIDKQTKEVKQKDVDRRETHVEKASEKLKEQRTKERVSVKENDVQQKINKTESAHVQSNANTSENKTTSQFLREQRAYTIGLQTIPNIRGTVHSSYHFNLLLKTFFIHLTDVMVALSRFILSEPVFNEKQDVCQQKDVSESTFTETVVKKDKAESKIDKVEKKAKEEEKKEIDKSKRQQNTEQIVTNRAHMVERNYELDNENLELEELEERRKLSGSRMAQLVEKKSDELITRMDAVVSEFQTKTGIEDVATENSERSRSRQSEIITAEHTESRTESRASDTYIAIVQSHVYTNKNLIRDEITDFTDTKSFVSTDKTSMAQEEISATSKVSTKDVETKKDVVKMVAEEQKISCTKEEVVQMKQKEVKAAEFKIAEQEAITHTVQKEEIKAVLPKEEDRKPKAATVMINKAVLPRKEKVDVRKEEVVEMVQQKTSNVAEKRETIQEEIKTAEVVKKKPRIAMVSKIVLPRREKVDIKQETAQVMQKEVRQEETKTFEKIHDTEKKESIQEVKVVLKPKVATVMTPRLIPKRKESVEVKKERVEIIQQKKEKQEVQKTEIKSKEIEVKAIEEIKNVEVTLPKPEEKRNKVRVAMITRIVPPKREKVKIEEKEEFVTLKLSTAAVSETQKKIEGLVAQETGTSKMQEFESRKQETAVTKTETEAFISRVNEIYNLAYGSKTQDINKTETKASETKTRGILKHTTNESKKQDIKIDQTSIALKTEENTATIQQTTDIKKEAVTKGTITKEAVKKEPVTKETVTKEAVNKEITKDKSPSPPMEPPTPVTDEYMFKLEIPLPKRSGPPIPRDCTPTPEDEDPDIVKRKFLPHIETKIEGEIKYDPPLQTPLQSPTEPRAAPVYKKPGLRGGADKSQYTKEEILEIERKSSLLASAIEQTIKSIEEYKEEVGIKPPTSSPVRGGEFTGNYNGELSEETTQSNTYNNTNGVVYNGYAQVVETKIFNPNFESKMGVNENDIEAEIEQNGSGIVNNIQSKESGYGLETTFKVPNIKESIAEVKKDPMEGYRPIHFDPNDLQGVIEQQRQARMASVPILTPSQERDMYKTQTGELMGTVQGIVGGLEEAVVEPEVAKEMGKPGISEEKIAELISGEAEMLREAHVMGLSRVLASHMHRPDDSSVDFKKIKPLVESLKDSEVLKAINEEILKKAKEEKKKDDRKWTTFLQKPKRPVPKCKFGYHGYVAQEQEIQEPYKVKIVKQPKPKVAPDYKPKPEEFNTGLLPWEERALREPTPPPVEAEDPILIPEEAPEILEAVDPLPESEVPDLEDSGIPLPPPKEKSPAPIPEDEQPLLEEDLDLDAIVEETEKIVGENIESLVEVEEMDQGNLAEQLMMKVQNMVDPNAPLEQQLAQMRAQLAALAQLPCVIQQSLELVTKQLSQLSQVETQTQQQATTQVVSTTTEVCEEQQTTEVVENNMEKQEETQQVSITEVENVEQKKPEVTAEEIERMRREEEEMLERQRQEEKTDKMKKEQMERERLEFESRQVKHHPTPRVGKPRPAFGPLHPEPRPLVLPGGRRWRGPKDAINEQLFTETLAAQAEMLRGNVKGINFMKWEKPPVSLDHLQNSETFKMVHNMEQAPQKKVELLRTVIAECDYREKCRSITPCTERMAREEHLDIPQQVQP